jgi:hypothetical protein
MDPDLIANSYPKVTVPKSTNVVFWEQLKEISIATVSKPCHLKLLTLLASAYKNFSPNIDTIHPFVAP